MRLLVTSGVNGAWNDGICMLWRWKWRAWIGWEEPRRWWWEGFMEFFQKTLNEYGDFANVLVNFIMRVLFSTDTICIKQYKNSSLLYAFPWSGVVWKWGHSLRKAAHSSFQLSSTASKDFYSLNSSFWRLLSVLSSSQFETTENKMYQVRIDQINSLWPPKMHCAHKNALCSQEIMIISSLTPISSSDKDMEGVPSMQNQVILCK